MKNRSATSSLPLFGLAFLTWASLCPAPPIPVCPDCIAPVFDNGPVNPQGEPMGSGEFVTSGDFDGDGHTDILILDKATGLWRSGAGNALDTGYSFDEARASGVEQITGMTAGHFAHEGITSVLVCSPIMNRLNVIANGAGSFEASAQPMDLTSPGAGPFALGAVDVPGAANTALPEIALASEANTGSAPNQRHVLRTAQTGSYYADTTSNITRRVLRLGSIAMDTAGTFVLGAITVSTSNTHRFDVWQPSNGNFTTTSAMTNLPLGSKFISGFFEGSNVDIVFFVQGSPNVRVARIGLDQSSNAILQSSQSITLPHAVRALYPLKRDTGTTVLALYSDNTFDVLAYTAVAGFSTAEGNQAPGNAALPVPTTGAVALANGDFVMLTGDASDPDAGSTHAHRFKFNPATGKYDLASTSALPAAKIQSATGNVLVFSKNPLSNPDAFLVRSARVRDWTRNLSWQEVTGLTDLSLDAESYVSRADGLGNKQAATLPFFMSGSQVALGNQASDAVSIFTFDSTLGSRTDDIAIDPPAGSYDEAVRVILRTRDPNTTIFFRKGSSAPFSVFSGEAWLFADTTIEYYGRDLNGLLTPRKSASFHFTRNAKEQDADGDGVPDFVERAYGLDPNGSLTGDGTPSDFDSDGWTDLAEILAGADANVAGLPGPATPTTHPPKTWTPPSTSQQFKFWVKVRGMNADGTESVAAPGTVIEVHDTTGAFLATAPVIAYADGTRWAHVTVQPVADAERILIVSTPSHFRMGAEPWPAQEPEPLGRELLGYVKIPPVTPLTFDPTFNFTFDPDADLTEQAQAWVDARRLATGGTREQPSITVNYNSTLKLLLLERILRDLAPMHGIMFGGSLTPFRDAAQTSTTPGISSAQIAQLQTAPASWSSPSEIRAWKFDTLLSAVDDWLAHPSTSMATIIEGTKQVYRISSERNNASPGVYAPPVNVLREWVQHTVLDSTYLAHFTGIDPAAASMAPMGFYSLTFGIPTRPVFDQVGTPLASSSTDDTTFTAGATAYNLIDANTSAYRWPTSITPTTPVRIIAFDDVSSGPPHHNLEVIRASIDSLYNATSNDADNNLLPDAWELYYFGATGLNALSNGDGSSFSLLQEYLQGTDPTRSVDNPTSTPVVLQVANLALQWPLQSTDICVRWTFPPGFGSAFNFGLQTSTDLHTFSETPLDVLEESPGNFCITVPKPATSRSFFRIVTRLK